MSITSITKRGGATNSPVESLSAEKCDRDLRRAGIGQQKGFPTAASRITQKPKSKGIPRNDVEFGRETRFTMLQSENSGKHGRSTRTEFNAFSKEHEAVKIEASKRLGSNEADHIDSLKNRDLLAFYHGDYLRHLLKSEAPAQRGKHVPSSEGTIEKHPSHIFRDYRNSALEKRRLKNPTESDLKIINFFKKCEVYFGKDWNDLFGD